MMKAFRPNRGVIRSDEKRRFYVEADDGQRWLIIEFQEYLYKDELKLDRKELVGLKKFLTVNGQPVDCYPDGSYKIIDKGIQYARRLRFSRPFSFSFLNRHLLTYSRYY